MDNPAAQEPPFDGLSSEQTDILAEALSEFSLYLTQKRPPADSAASRLDQMARNLPDKVRTPFLELAAESLRLEQDFTSPRPGPGRRARKKGHSRGRLIAWAGGVLGLGTVLLLAWFFNDSLQAARTKITALEKKLQAIEQRADDLSRTVTNYEPIYLNQEAIWAEKNAKALTTTGPPPDENLEAFDAPPDESKSNVAK